MPSLFEKLRTGVKEFTENENVKALTKDVKDAVKSGVDHTKKFAEAAKAKTNEVLIDLAPKSKKEELLKELQFQIRLINDFLAEEQRRKTKNDEQISLSVSEAKVQRKITDAPHLLQAFNDCIDALEGVIPPFKLQKAITNTVEMALEMHACESEHSTVVDVYEKLFGNKQPKKTGLDLVNETIKHAQELSDKLEQRKKAREALAINTQSNSNDSSPNASSYPQQTDRFFTGSVSPKKSDQHTETDLYSPRSPLM